ncbi:TetR/AcrR family transcriptional regulator [Propionibacteriaceae bacterium Y1700]|uniref:TetR/AcrR family transcriptional regulator n=1 Tax=Microlunatus sp. Y1700 TaxID=3418487 RepID=UPI003DA6E0FB
MKDAPVTQLTARRSATRERLLQAAVEVFAEAGVLGASVEQICERAGFTRGAFYSNFDSKDDLCLALLQAQGQKSYEAIERHTRENQPEPGPVSPETVRANVRSILSLLLDQMDSDASVLFAMEMRAYAVRTPSVLPVYREVSMGLTNLFSDLVEGLLDAHHMKLKLPPAQAFTLLSAMCEYALLNAKVMQRDRDAAVEELADTIELLLAPADD